MGDENVEQNPRAKLYKLILSSRKIQRHSKFAMILLVGSSGSGKSSTINHLLGTGVAKTSNNQSSTQKTSEYIITFDEPKYEVSDLTMRIIDTPGFNDGDGDKQDACNFLCIKKYFETHPELKEETKIYSNIVFLVTKADDNRIEGPNTQLSKSLRFIKLLDVVDISHPNLVVILTHACSVGYQKMEKWHETMQEKKNFVSDLVFQTLGVRAPVVLIENNPDNYGLEKNGDFSILPNGERQPLNLYNACLSLLRESRDKADKFGQMLLNAAFTRKRKNRPTNGHEVKAKIAKKESLSVEELKLANDFYEASKRGFDKEMSNALVSKLKPLPSSDDKFKAEYDTFKNFDETSERLPQAILHYFSLSSAKIQRHFQFAMILLVGSTGCGKSSTINHLMDTGDGFPVAETSYYGSRKRKTSEYIITFDEPKYEVSDLTMRIIDTPGFNDDDGVQQDACNFVSVKKYFETHPKFLSKTKFYPNLVFIVDKANNNRMKGVYTHLSKSLRGVKMLDVVDISHPNLVVILTHACSVGCKDVRKWHETMQEKKILVSDLVFQILGVRAPVVLIENNPYDYGLKKDGDFTILPNGERQPLNLYNACLSLLKKSKDGNDITDKFGHMVLNAAFTQKKKEKPTKGHEVKAKIADEEELSDEELKLVERFTKAAEEES
ncbi:uncharacterized protein LOC124443683 [Xenia sp. Carnegie-2017]|uniref:uncharacterized protein LOC124443683 n=1 Tax=Xenia sp. Carnegie-2017 TaxID=2897299 RepID=UPI001F03A12B|nr:uncharacterized protein LOC124443683 [Xenia sp. Carnegie-2017]XP_046850126.1 uncharacterized protein LOC124443683 [Xenia sp. Carnegie-2017]XP_046850127.1 uncharacterized protein LOC124443683 [Xenia sp. Carnegie-2017]